MDVTEPKFLWGMGVALITNVRKIECFGKGIEMSFLPALLLFEMETCDLFFSIPVTKSSIAPMGA